MRVVTDDLPVRAVIDGLPENLSLEITRTDGYTVVNVDAGNTILGKLYLSYTGVVISPDDSNREKGQRITWRELSNRAQQD